MIKRLVQGVGINDADYLVEGCTDGVRWVCPFYKTWKSMVVRCNSVKYKARRPTYAAHSVCEQWLVFSNFKVWMETQDWEGKALDKDLLVSGNTVYSPETCVFVSPRVNSFITEKKSGKAGLPTGVSYRADRGKFVAKLRSTEYGYEYLGSFDTPEEAHKAWCKRKNELAFELAMFQTNPKVKDALLKIDYEEDKNDETT